MPESIRDRAFARDHEQTEQQPQAATPSLRRSEPPQQTQLGARRGPSSLRSHLEATSTPPERPTALQGHLAATGYDPERETTTAMDLVMGTRRMSTTEFQKGFENSMNMLASSGSASAALITGTLGMEDTSRRFAERAQARLESGPQHEPTNPEFRSISNVSDAGNYLAHLAGSQLPILGSIIGTALVTRGMSTRLPGMRQLQAQRAGLMTEAMRSGNTEAGRRAALESAQVIARRMNLQANTGSTLGSIGAIMGVTSPEQAELLLNEDATGSYQQRAAGALTSTVAAGAVGVLPVHRFLRSAGMGASVQRDVMRAHNAAVRDGIQNLTGRQLPQRGWLNHMSREVPIQAGLQGIVEIGQEASLRAAHAAFLENVGMFDDEAIGRYLEAAVASTIIGGVLGGLGPTVQAATLKIAEQAENVGSLSEGIADRMDAHQKKLMRNKIFNSPYKTPAFREIREIDSLLIENDGMPTQEVRERLAPLVGPENVDTMLQVATENNTPLETVLAERLRESKGEAPEVQILASRVQRIGEDPSSIFETGKAHLIGETILEQWGRGDLRQVMDNMSEGERHDLNMMVGEMAQTLARSKFEEMTAEDVTYLRGRMSEVLHGDDALESALLYALRQTELVDEMRLFLENTEGLTEAELLNQGETRQILDSDEAQVRDMEYDGTVNVAGENQAFLRTRYQGSDTTRSQERNKPQAILDHPVLGDLIPFVRAEPEPGKQTAAQKSAESLSQRTGLEFQVRNLGDDLFEQNLSDSEIVDIANQIIRQAKSQESGRVPAWVKGRGALRKVESARDFLNNFEVAALSDEALAADRANVEMGGFAASRLARVVKDPDLSGLPREDQVGMISPTGERVVVDLVTANREIRQIARERRQAEQQRERHPAMGQRHSMSAVPDGRLNSYEGATQAVAQLMEQGFRFPTQEETAAHIRQQQERLRKATRRGDIPKEDRLTVGQIRALREQLENFKARGGNEGITETSVVDRLRAQRPVPLHSALDPEWQSQHGVLASVADQKVDEGYFATLADRMERQVTKLAEQDATANADSITGASGIATAMWMLSDGNLDGATDVVRSLTPEEMQAGMRVYDATRQQFETSFEDAAVRIEDTLLGPDVAQQRRELRKESAQKALERAQERIARRPARNIANWVLRQLESDDQFKEQRLREGEKSTLRKPLSPQRRKALEAVHALFNARARGDRKAEAKALSRINFGWVRGIESQFKINEQQLGRDLLKQFTDSSPEDIRLYAEDVGNAAALVKESRQASKTPTYDKLPAQVEGKRTMTYAGVGSRNTPPEVQQQMTRIAQALEARGYTLNTGDAKGADAAFAKGAKKKNQFAAKDATDQTRAVAKELHPAWHRLGPYAQNLQARNTNQVFGRNLDTPADFIIVWTPDGAQTHAERNIGTGGTGQAISLASLKGIPVINLAQEGWQQTLEQVLEDGPRKNDSAARLDAALEFLNEALVLATPERRKQFDQAIAGMRNIPPPAEVVSNLFGERVAQEIALAEYQLERADLRRELKKGLEPALKRQIEDQLNAIELITKVTERRVEQKPDTRPGQQFRAAQETYRGVMEAAKKLNLMLDDSLYVPQYIDASPSQKGGLDNLLLIASPGVEQKLTLHDFYLKASNDERNMLSIEFDAFNESVYNIAELETALKDFKAHQELVMQFAQLNMTEGTVNLAESMPKVIAATIENMQARGQRVTEESVLENTLRSLNPVYNRIRAAQEAHFGHSLVGTRKGGEKAVKYVPPRKAARRAGQKLSREEQQAIRAERAAAKKRAKDLAQSLTFEPLSDPVQEARVQALAEEILRKGVGIAPDTLLSLRSAGDELQGRRAADARIGALNRSVWSLQEHAGQFAERLGITNADSYITNAIRVADQIRNDLAEPDLLFRMPELATRPPSRTPKGFDAWKNSRAEMVKQYGRERVDQLDSFITGLEAPSAQERAASAKQGQKSRRMKKAQLDRLKMNTARRQALQASGLLEVMPLLRTFVSTGIAIDGLASSTQVKNAVGQGLNNLVREYQFFAESDQVQKSIAEIYAQLAAIEDGTATQQVDIVASRADGYTAFLNTVRGDQAYSEAHRLTKKVVQAIRDGNNDALPALKQEVLSVLNSEQVVEALGAHYTSFLASAVDNSKSLVSILPALSATKTRATALLLEKKALVASDALTDEAFATMSNVEVAALHPAYNISMPAQRKNQLSAMINNLMQPLGLKVKIVTSAQEVVQALENTDLSRLSKDSIMMQALDVGMNGFVQLRNTLDAVEFVRSDDEIFMYVSGRLSETEAVLTAVHEMGHIFEFEVFARETDDVQNQIFAAYEEHLRQTVSEDVAGRAIDLRKAVMKKRGAADLLFSGGPYTNTKGETGTIGLLTARAIRANRTGDFDSLTETAKALEYHLGFREWWADQVRQWASTNAKPRTVVEKFFKRVADAFKMILDRFRTQQIPHHDAVHRYLNERFFNTTPQEFAAIMNRERSLHWEDYTESFNFGDLLSDALKNPRLKEAMTRAATEGSGFIGQKQLLLASLDTTIDPGSLDTNYGIRDVVNHLLTADERNLLERTFNRPRVREQIIESVKDDIAWLVEIESNSDAMVATGYQLWEAGLLVIPPRAAGIFGKIDDTLTNKIFGEFTQIEQAEQIMNAMFDGRIQRRQSIWTQIAPKESNIAKQRYGLSPAQLVALRGFAEGIHENDTPRHIANRLSKMRRFKDDNMNPAARYLLAVDLKNGVFTDEVVGNALQAPTWALNPEQQFVVQRAIFDGNVANFARGLRHGAHWLGQRASRIFFGQMMKARQMKVQAYTNAVNTIYRDVASGRFSQSYDQTKTMNIAKYMNRYANIIKPLENTDKTALRDAILEGRHMSIKDGDTVAAVKAQKEYVKLMQDMRDHARAAGLQLGDLGAGAGRIFAPWVFNEKMFREGGDDFYNFATQKHYQKHWLALAKSKDASTDWTANNAEELKKFIRNYIRVLGNQEGFADSEVIVDPNRHTQPHSRSMFKRELDFLWREGTAEDRKTLAGYLDQNLNTVIATYINQVMKRATYHEFFGDGRLEEMSAQIIAGGGTPEMVQMLHDAVDMQMGTYGLDMTPSLQRIAERMGSWFGKDWSDLDPAKYREFQGYIVTYQNIRTLAYAALTNVVDGAGIYVRSGSLTMAAQGMVEGFKAMRADAKGKIELNALAEQAEMLGVAEKVVVQDALGQLYGGVHFTGTAAKINDAFFRYNGMMTLNRFLRMSALSTAQIYAKKHAALATRGNKKSAKILHDLGLTVDDITLDSRGNIKMLSDNEIARLSHGLRIQEIQKRVLSKEAGRELKSKEARQQQEDFQEVLRDQRVRDSLFRFVDEAVMRPSAMQRPNWGNDPNWGMFFHLKAFMYTYHERHLRRAMSKMMEEGNAGPAVMMLSFVGLMMAVDALREVIQFGPGGDPRKDDWTFADRAWDGAHRSGIYGAANYIPDIRKTMELRQHRDPLTRWTSPLIEMGGPAVSQMDQLVRAGFGERRQRAMMDAMPASNLVRSMHNWGQASEDMGMVETQRSIFDN